MLQPTTSQWAPSPSLEAVMKDLVLDQTAEETLLSQDNNEAMVISKNAGDKQSMVTAIMHELQKELDRPNIEVINSSKLLTETVN